MSETIWTHVGIVAGIVLPLGSGILWLIWNASQQTMKVNTMWDWFTNHGSDITGYKPGDERKCR